MAVHHTAMLYVIQRQYNVLQIRVPTIPANRAIITTVVISAATIIQEAVATDLASLAEEVIIIHLQTGIQDHHRRHQEQAAAHTVRAAAVLLHLLLPAAAALHQKAVPREAQQVAVVTKGD